MQTPQQTFQQITGQRDPHPWQASLANDPVIRDRLIRIPTGFGKTQGVPNDILPEWRYRYVRE